MLFLIYLFLYLIFYSQDVVCTEYKVQDRVLPVLARRYFDEDIQANTVKRGHNVSLHMVLRNYEASKK